MWALDGQESDKLGNDQEHNSDNLEKETSEAEIMDF